MQLSYALSVATVEVVRRIAVTSCTCFTIGNFIRFYQFNPYKIIMAENQAIYSLDEDFDELQDKDKTVELVGYVCSVEAPIRVKQYDLFKFGLTNGGSKKVMCLAWNKPLTDTLPPNITINKILHIDGAHCKASKFPKLLEQAGFLPLEIVIQSSTTIGYLGMHNSDVKPVPDAPVLDVNFETIIEAEGQISINGFIKTEFAAIQSRYQNSTYGCGSITNGIIKITVNVANFQTLNLRKGTPVTVVGVVNHSSGLLTISCTDSTMITQREGVEPLTEVQLMRGTRLLKRRHED